MIRTTITPATTEILFSIPKEYIGKKVEILFYMLEEVESVPAVATTKKKPSDFAGTLTHAAANKLMKYVEKSRSEWERDI